MEAHINREILAYTDTIFFGLDLRQFLGAAAAVAAAAAIWWFGRAALPGGLLSWLCILGAFPPALLGFWKPNGMNCFEAAVCIVRCLFLERRPVLPPAEDPCAALLLRGHRKEAWP